MTKAATALAGALLAAGLVGCGSGSGEGPAEVKAAHTESSAPAPVTPAGAMKASPPTGVKIPSLGVDAKMMDLGINQADGEIEVPPKGKYDLAGWYTGGPTPGEIGPAVIVGHLDGDTSKAVFYKLPQIKPGAEVQVPRADGTTALFTVRSIEQVKKDAFPTDRVYGDTSGSELRLITCGGELKGGHWDGNVIVYADLVR